MIDFETLLSDHGVLEEANKYSKGPNFPAIGTPPKNIDEIVASSLSKKSGTFVIPRYLKQMLPLGYGNADELIQYARPHLDKKKYGLNDALKKFKELYVPYSVENAISDITPTSTDLSAQNDATSNVSGIPESDATDGATAPVSNGGNVSTKNTNEGTDTTKKPSEVVPTPKTNALTSDESTKNVEAQNTESVEEPTTLPEAEPTKTAGRAKKLTEKELDELEEQALADLKNAKPVVARPSNKAMSRKAKELRLAGKGINKFREHVITILNHGIMKARGEKKFNMLLTGDPGTGKTTFIKQFGRLTGVPVVTIEAPHILKEHIINIPFIVDMHGKEKVYAMDFQDNGEKKGSDRFTIINAESNLVTTIKKERVNKNNEKKWASGVKQSARLWKLLTNDAQLTNFVERFRASYDAILFIDEYFRVEEASIRSILRNILNGNIGNDRIPKGVYIVFASNMKDDDNTGDIELPENTEMEKVNFEVQEPDEWFDWFKNEFVTDRATREKKYGNISEMSSEDVSALDEKSKLLLETAPINEELLAQYSKALNDIELGGTENGVRLSPRRLEQIMLGVSSMVDDAIASKDSDDIRAVFSFIRTNLKHYKTGNVAESMYGKLASVAEKFMTDAGLSADMNDFFKSTDWRTEMFAQLKLKQKLGDSRSYPFLIGGEPGIGKTVFISKMAQKLDMPVIVIGGDTLTKEMVIGIPMEGARENKVVGEDSNGNPILQTSLTTEITRPSLYTQIWKEYNENILKKKVPAEGRYKQILFIDEFTRVEDKNVFNALRKLMLEKQFGDNSKLPDDMMIVGALNPNDTGEEVKELTEHMRDVLDIIQGMPEWPEFRSYMGNALSKMEVVKEYNDVLGGDLIKMTLDAGDYFISKMIREEGVATIGDATYDMKNNIKLREFFWGLLDGSFLYINPREIEELYKGIASEIYVKLTMDEFPFDKNIDPPYGEGDISYYKDVISIASTNAVMSQLAIPLQKYGKQPEEIKGTVISVLSSENDEYTRYFNPLFEAGEAIHAKSLLETMTRWDWDFTREDDQFWKPFFNTYTNPADVSTQTMDMFTEFLDTSVISKFKNGGAAFIEFIGFIHTLVDKGERLLGSGGGDFVNILGEQLKLRLSDYWKQVVEGDDAEHEEVRWALITEKGDDMDWLLEYVSA